MTTTTTAILTKRPASHGHIKQGDIYINRNSSYTSQLKRIETLLFVTGIGKVTLYGLGACITRTTKLALAINQKDKSVTMSIHTFTTPVVDDLISNEVTLWKLMGK